MRSSRYNLLLLSVVFLMAIFIMGCQEIEHFDTEIAPQQVNIFKWDTGERIGTISDQGVIDSLVNDLQNARSSSTANMDFALPDYRLVFIHDDRTIFKVGYYKEIIDLGVTGRYWWKDRMYNLTMELSSITELEKMSNE